MAIEQRIKEYFEAWNAHEPKAVAKLFSDAGTYEDPMTRMAVHPRDIEAVLESIASVFPDFFFEVKDRTMADDRALVEWEMSGKNSKPLKPGIDATEKSLHLKGVDIFRGADGF